MKIINKSSLLIVLLFMALFAVFPFLWLLATSFKGAEEIFQFPPSFIPKQFHPENYTGVWSAIPFGTYLLNSTIVVVFSIILNLLVASMAGYAFARYRFKGKSFLFLIVLASIMIPKELVIIPVYTNILKIGLADTLTGVILPFAVEGFAIFMMRQAFLSIPRDMEEAAILDGCSPLQIWWKIMLPVTKPTLAVLALFTFIGTWGDFLWPLIVLQNRENYTLQVGLSYMMGTFVNNYRYVAAGAILALLPVLLVFGFAQKYLIRGVIAGTGK